MSEAIATRTSPKTRLALGAAIGVAVLTWLLAKAHEPKAEDIAAFLDHSLGYSDPVVFAANGSALRPAPAVAVILEADCGSATGSDFDQWVCLYTYEGADGGSYRHALTATRFGSLFREDTLGLANVGMFMVQSWAERDQRSMFAEFGQPLP